MGLTWTSQALSLLRGLLYERLGHRLPLPRVLRHCGYVLRLHLAATLWANVVYTVTGIMCVYKTAQPNDNIWTTGAINPGLPYLLLSLPLNILITLMIVIRLILHSRRTRNATGSLASIGKLYRTVATMLIESSALYSLSSFVVIGPMIANFGATNMFLSILAEVQVCAFPSPRSPDQCNVTIYLAGHRSTAHY